MAVKNQLTVGGRGVAESMNDLKRDRLSRVPIIWFLAGPPPPSPVSKLKRLYKGRLRKRDNLLIGGGRGAESLDCKRAWSSINPSILSGGGNDVGSESVGVYHAV